jgi:hypothetical protein
MVCLLTTSNWGSVDVSKGLLSYAKSSMFNNFFVFLTKNIS